MSLVAHRDPTIVRLTSADAEPEREPDFTVTGDFYDVIIACQQKCRQQPVGKYIASPDDACWSVWAIRENETTSTGGEAR